MTEALQQAERLLTHMSPGEKAQLLRWVMSELSDAPVGVVSTSGVCGGEACIVGTRIPIWLLEQARRLGVGEADLLRSYPTLRAEDLANAWSYARCHAEEIDRAIRANESA